MATKSSTSPFGRRGKGAGEAGAAVRGWDDDAVVTVATNRAAVPRDFMVDFGLTQPGTKIALKVYVLTTTGRERGSAVMVVERPPAWTRKARHPGSGPNCENRGREAAPRVPQIARRAAASPTL